MIELRSVTKLYSTVIGVNDISLTLEPGVYGLLGPNGSGKTTLINLIIGQIQPTLGCVSLFGENPWRRDRLLRQVGLCPAYEINIPNVTGLEWVTYLVQLHGFSRREAVKRASDALTFLKIDHAMKRSMRDYSLGMRQRVKLAQAIAHEPRLLILDEPFNGLDPVARHEMIEFLKSWSVDGRSLILASHILHEVQAVNPSFLLISGGRLLASGSSEEVRALLADSPNQFLIRCRRPRALAARLMQHESVRHLRIDSESGLIEVSSDRPAALMSDLPSMTLEDENFITEFHTTEEPLKELFSSLMRFHRGENQPSVRLGR